MNKLIRQQPVTTEEPLHHFNGSMEDKFIYINGMQIPMSKVLYEELDRLIKGEAAKDAKIVECFIEPFTKEVVK